MMMLNQIQTRLQLTNAIGIDFNQQLSFAVFDKNTSNQFNYAIIMTLKDLKEFLASLPKESLSSDKSKHTYIYLNPKSQRKVYVNLFEKHAIFTPTQETFQNHQAFLKTLSAQQFNDIGAIHLAGPSIHKYFQNSKGLFNTMKSMPNVNDKVLQSIADLADTSLRSLAEIAMTFRVTPMGMQIDFRFKATADSGFSEYLHGFTGGRHIFIDQVPSNSFLVVSSSFANSKSITHTLVKSEIFRQMQSLIYNTSTDRFIKNIEEMEKYLTGHFTHALLPDPKTIFSSVSWIGINDRDNYTKTLKQSFMLQKKLMASKSSDKRKANSHIMIKENAYTVNQEHVMILHNLNTLYSDDPQAILNMPTETHVLPGDQFFLMASHSEPRQQLESTSKIRKGLGQQVAWSSIMQMLPKSPVLLVYISPTQFMKEKGKLNRPDLSAKIDTITSKYGIGLSFTNQDDALQMMFSIPKVVLKESMEAFSQLKMYEKNTIQKKLSKKPSRLNIVKTLKALDLKKCVLQFPQPKGQVRVKIRAISSGAIVQSTVINAPFKGTALAGCIESEVKKQKVEPFTNASIQFTFPFRID